MGEKNGPAQRETKIILPQRGFWQSVQIIEEVVRVEHVITKIIEKVAM